MNIKILKPINALYLLMISTVVLLNSCGNADGNQKADSKTNSKTGVKYPSDVTPTFKHWNLILGDGTNAGPAVDFEDKNFFYSASDETGDWVVFKSPNAGNTHGTSNNTRTELAQLKKWTPMMDAKMNATLKVMNVSKTGDARVASTHSVVIGQIHSADGHENEPLKIFYKKFPGHTKGSVFWN